MTGIIICMLFCGRCLALGFAETGHMKVRAQFCIQQFRADLETHPVDKTPTHKSSKDGVRYVRRCFDLDASRILEDGFRQNHTFRHRTPAEVCAALQCSGASRTDPSNSISLIV